jgi:hypothetical protein
MTAADIESMSAAGGRRAIGVLSAGQEYPAQPAPADPDRITGSDSGAAAPADPDRITGSDSGAAAAAPAG